MGLLQALKAGRWRGCRFALATILAYFASWSVALAASAAIEEFPIGGGESDPADVVVGPDGKVWFTEFNGNRISSLDPDTGAVDRFDIGVRYGSPGAITVGADGNLWFTEEAYEALGRLDPDTGEISEWGPVKGSASFSGITSGPDGNIWFTEYRGNQIVRSEYVSEERLDWTKFPIPTERSRPYDIAVGVDDNLWFTEVGARQLGKVSPADGQIQEYPLRRARRPTGIATAPDGAIWIAATRSDRLIRLYPDRPRVQRRFPVPKGSGPSSLVVAADGLVWFTEQARGRIGRLNPRTGRVKEFRTRSRDTEPDGIAIGEGSVWFAEFSGDRIGRIRINR